MKWLPEGWKAILETRPRWPDKVWRRMGWLFSYPHNLAVSMNNKEEEESNYQEKQKQKRLDVIDWLFRDLMREC